MNFEDEPYVRLYVRDTKTWLRLGFEGQCVLMFLLRKLDKAGVLDGMDDLHSDVALVSGVPEAIVAVGMPRLVKWGVFQLVGNRLVMPNYIQAQNAIRTDKARQRDMREKRLAKARLVTPRDTTSREPTPDDALSQDVTLYSADLVCTDPLSAVVEPAQTEPPTHNRVPEDWKVTEEFYSEATLAGVTHAGLDEAVKYWRGRKLGGDWFTIEDFFRGKFAAIKIYEEKARFAQQQERGGRRPTPASELDTTGAATAFRPSDAHREYARSKDLALDWAASEYRKHPTCARLSTVEQERDFLNRLRCWCVTGTFIPDGPLPAPRKAPGHSAGGKEAA